MAGQQALLLFGCLLPGLLFSEAAKILTVSLVGKCSTEDPETGKQPLVRESHVFPVQGRFFTLAS